MYLVEILILNIKDNIKLIMVVGQEMKYILTHILVTDLLEEVLVIMVYMDHKLGHSMIQTEMDNII